MKYAVISCDGMSERIIHEEKTETPLSSACIPASDRLSCSGEYGIAKTTDSVNLPDTLRTNMYLMGYDPRCLAFGESALRAVAGGISISPGDVVFSCKPVSLSDEEKYADKTILSCISDVNEEENRAMCKLLSDKLGSDTFSFRVSSCGELFLIWHKGEPDPGIFYSPDAGKKMTEALPKGDFVEPLCILMKKSYDVCFNAAVNEKRKETGKQEISGIFISEAGIVPEAVSFIEKYGIRGTVISNDTGLSGFAELIGMESVFYKDIESSRIAEEAVDRLRGGTDYVYIHISSPLEYSLKTDAAGKLRSIGIIDKYVVSKVIEGLSGLGEEYRIMLISSFSCSGTEGYPTSEPVPYVIYDSQSTEGVSDTSFSEHKAFEAGNYLKYGTDITKYLISAD